MALTLNPATRLISIPQADLTFISGTLYTLDSNQFRKDVWDLLSSEAYIWLPPAFTHNTEVTVAGITYARTLEFINGFQIQFEDTGSAYTVRIEGSNNNIFDVENGILVPTSLVTVIPTNSAGLQTVTSGSGVTAQDKIDIRNEIMTFVMENGESFAEQIRLMRAEAAGSVRKTGNVHRFRDAADSKDRITATATADDRDVTATDGT